MSKEKQANTKATTDNEATEPADGAVEVEIKTDEETPDGDNGAQEAAEAEPELTEEEKLAARVAELDDQLLRKIAEFDNYKKRTARQFEDIVRGANERLLRELLEVVDNFERALDQANSGEDDDAYRQGMRLIYEQLIALLERNDVTPIEAVGRPFDPNLHEAVMQTESDEHPEGTVALEISKGYRLGDRVLRHTKVGVSKGSGEEAARSESEDTDGDS